MRRTFGMSHDKKIDKIATTYITKIDKSITIIEGNLGDVLYYVE